MQPIGSILIGLGVLVFLLSLAIHKVDEGHVAVYYRVRDFLFFYYYKEIKSVFKRAVLY
jgi:hypothetical protein